MGKFFTEKIKIKRDRATLIKYGIVAAGILLIIILFIAIAAGKNRKKATFEVVDSLEVEINSKKPDKMEFFKKFENYDKGKVSVEYNTLDMSKIGSYFVTLVTEDYGSEDIEVNVVDKTAPTLKLKEHIIAVGEAYSIDDFIESCEDNSNEPCTYQYAKANFDEEGNPVNYSEYTKDGTYSIKIVAADGSGNTSEVIETKLTIGNGTSSIQACTYGNLDYNESIHSYPISIIVGDQNSNCAINYELWDDEATQKPVNDLYNQDYAKLKNDLKSVLDYEYPNGANVNAYPKFIAVLNNTKTGLVGYAIQVKVYINAVDSGSSPTESDLKLSYYINPDKSRTYETNVYNLG